MKLVDANVLLYAVNSDAKHHEAAFRWLETALAGREPVGFAWPVLLAFLRVVTNPAVFRSPWTPEEALAQCENWVESPPATVVEPTARHLTILRGLLEESGTAGNLVIDAHLAALAVEAGAPIVSYDRDFERFAGVTRIEPS